MILDFGYWTLDTGCWILDDKDLFPQNRGSFRLVKLFLMVIPAKAGIQRDKLKQGSM